MRKIYSYIVIFLIGALLAFLYFNKELKENKKENIVIMLNEIKNVSKLVVVESSYTQMYNYENSKYFLIEPFSFDKRVILVVNAKIQISYDLSQMEIETDTVNRKVIINYIPKEEVLVVPNISYYDLEQSTFNSFTKEELNTIHKKSIKKIKEASNIAKLKERAKEQLIAELGKIYTMTTLLEWEFIDNTGLGIAPSNFKD